MTEQTTHPPRLTCPVCRNLLASPGAACRECGADWPTIIESGLKDGLIVPNSSGPNRDARDQFHCVIHLAEPLFYPFGVGAILHYCDLGLGVVLIAEAAVFLFALLGFRLGFLARRIIGTQYKYTDLKNTVTFLGRVPRQRGLRWALFLIPIGLAVVAMISVVQLVITHRPGVGVDLHSWSQIMFVPAALMITGFLRGFIGQVQTGAYTLFARKPSAAESTQRADGFTINSKGATNPAETDGRQL